MEVELEERDGGWMIIETANHTIANSLAR